MVKGEVGTVINAKILDNGDTVKLRATQKVRIENRISRSRKRDHTTFIKIEGKI